MAAFRKRDVLLLFLAIFFCDGTHASSNLPYRQGILEAKSGNAVESLCVIFYPGLTSYPSEKENGVYESLLNLSEMWDGCSIPCEIVAAAIKDEIVLVNELGNCSIIEKAQSVERLGGKGIIIMVAAASLEPLPSNATYPAVIPIALLCSDPKNILIKGLSDCVEVLIHSPVSITSFDYSLLAIFAFSMLAVGIGAYCGGLKEYCFRQKETQQIEKETVIKISPLFLTAFILCACGIIALFEYLYLSYKVNVIVTMFIFVSAMGFYGSLEPVFHRIDLGSFTVSYKLDHITVEISELLLCIPTVVLVTCWAVYRKESFAWILLDVLSFALSIFIISECRFTSLKCCAILFNVVSILTVFLNLVLIIYISSGVIESIDSGNPYSNNSSNIVDSDFLPFAQMIIQEQLPMFIRFPYLGYDPLSVCHSQQQYSIFALADIVIPGMIIGFCHCFDLARGNGSKIYYITTLVAYGLGLVTSFAVFYLTTSPQLATLYVVPFTLIPIIILGLCRGELKLLWEGGEEEQLPMVEQKELTDFSRFSKCDEELGEFSIPIEVSCSNSSLISVADTRELI